MNSLDMFIKSLLCYKHILKFGSHASADFTIKMWLFKMLYSLFIIIKIHIFELIWAFVTNVAFLMGMLKMSPKLIDIIKSLFTECACRMEQYKITVFTELSIFNMTLILILSVQNLLRMYAFSIVETYITILSLMFQIKMFFQLVQTFKKLLTFVKWAIITCFIFDLFSNRLIRVKVIFVFLNVTKMYTSLFNSSIYRDFNMSVYEYFSMCYKVTKIIFSFSSTLVLALRIIYLTKRTAKIAFFYHVDTASPADVFMITFW